MVSRDDVACKRRCKEREGERGRVKMLWGTCHSETQGFLSSLPRCSCTVPLAARPSSGAPVLDAPTTWVAYICDLVLISAESEPKSGNRTV